MSKNFFKSYFSLFFIIALGGIFCLGDSASAGFNLFRSQQSGIIYYLDSRNVRHTFPNQLIYESWYGNNFSGVITVSNKYLAQYQLGKNMTVRPGTYLVKIQTLPTVYAVEQGAVLRAIDNEDVAVEIYGKSWAKRVIDIPDVFFNDYTIGKTISRVSDTPNNVLFYNQLDKKYYFKAGELVEPFDSAKSVTANFFKLSDAIVMSRSYAVKQKPIIGFSAVVFNPIAKPLIDNSDCENKKLKTAVIFVADKEYASDEVTRVQKIKDKISDQYKIETNSLSQMDVSYPLNITLNNGYILGRRNDGAIDVYNELINNFYENNEDIFDFIVVFTNFKTPEETDSNEIAHFSPVTNVTEGIGRNILKAGQMYGSGGKLKGVIMMGNINKYETETTNGLNKSLEYVMHEFLHQWAAYIPFQDADGNLNYDLLRSPDKSHWNYYAGFVSPEGGSGWIDNHNGTFTNALVGMSQQQIRTYSQLDLYLMGLIPYQLMDPIMYIKPATPNDMGNVIKATAQYVTIDQIIKANGQIGCYHNN